MKNSIEEDKEILNNIKAYMQENIDKGYHKFIYNDLGYEEKCIDVINAIEHILSEYKRVLKENEELKNFTSSIFNENIEKDFVPVQKIKDKIEEYKKMLLSCNRFSDVDRIKAINERILELEELLEGRKQNV